MLHACLHSVIFSELTASKYNTVSTGLQESYKPAKVKFGVQPLSYLLKKSLTLFIKTQLGLKGTKMDIMMFN